MGIVLTTKMSIRLNLNWLVGRLISSTMIRLGHMAWTHILRMVEHDLGNPQVKYRIGRVTCTLSYTYQFM